MKQIVSKEQTVELPKKGTVVKFQDGDYQFFTFYLKPPFWREMPVTFRCAPGRLAIDRFNWFHLYETDPYDIGEWEYLRCEPASRGRILCWMEVKISWLFEEGKEPIEKWVLDAMGAAREKKHDM